TPLRLAAFAARHLPRSRAGLSHVGRKQSRASDLPPPCGERLSFSSSALPWTMIPENSVANNEDLTHAGGERFFGFLSGCDEPPIVVGDHGIEAGADQSSHVETASDVDTPAFDMAAATMLAGIIGHGRDCDESR